MVIDLKVHNWGIAFRKPGKHGGALKHVDIIVRICHAKKRVPNPKILRCHSLEDHRAALGMSLVHPLPSKWAVLPLPMHTINATKHAREASSSIDLQQPSCILGIWLPQVLGTKHPNHSSTKYVQCLQTSSAHTHQLGHRELHMQASE